MTVDTKQATGRRKLHFESLDDIAADVEGLVSAEEVETRGNWTAGQILKHLSYGMNMALDGDEFKLPIMVRLFAPLMKKKMLNGEMPAGFKMPDTMADKLVPPKSTTLEEGVHAIRQAIERMKNEPYQERHPVFGKMSKEEWIKLQLRHAELHLSFLIPVND